ncbi:MAG: sulfur carrier protein ThiS [Deltaproteobacteria bacterium]|nr:sulfur carrier protein ThiS [Deltaproteobacteria bacterium]
MQIRLNGQSQSISEDLNLADLLARFEVDPRKVAVAKNLEVVVRSELDRTMLRDGDEIEIFQAVGGG